MATIDEVKEILNTLRIALSIIIGIIVVLTGSLVGRYDANRVDFIFWTGFIVTLILMIFVIVIVVKLSKKTKEIKDL